MPHRAEESRRQLLRYAALALATVLLAFAAFDDITTDTAITFRVEWGALAACAVTMFIVSWRLLQRGDWWLGSISMVALAAAVGAGSTIARGISPFQIEYLTTIAALFWFLGLAAILSVRAWRRNVTRRAPSHPFSV